MDKPKIRPVEAFPVEHDGQTFVCLRDPTGLASSPILLGMGAYFVATLFDGHNSVRDVEAAFAGRFGEVLPSQQLEELIARLDEVGFLESPAMAERRQRVEQEFASAPQRAAAHAGLCYERDPVRLRAEIEGFFRLPEGPGSLPAAAADGRLAAPRGLIAPHIDPRRGAAAYAHAYGELAGRQPPELVVVLGTAHCGGGPELFAATRKDYATPLGAVMTDRPLVERLAKRYSGGDLFAQELLHRHEHSIEFQAVFLAWALGVGNFRTVPILVGSFYEMVGRGRQPAEDPRVGAFIEALRAELAAERRRVLVVAGVDFAHVGRKFGDPFRVDETEAERVRRDDRELIAHIERCDPAGFFAAVARDGDSRRICGLAPIYVALELLAGCRGRLLKHAIALELQTGSAVSFASIVID